MCINISVYTFFFSHKKNKCAKQPGQWCGIWGLDGDWLWGSGSTQQPGRLEEVNNLRWQKHTAQMTREEQEEDEMDRMGGGESRK